MVDSLLTIMIMISDSITSSASELYKKRKLKKCKKFIK